MNQSPIISSAGTFVEGLLDKKLSHSRFFHNLAHTHQVVAAAKEICAHESVTPEEMELVILAAWFHDTGHISCYKGHEVASQRIAKDFLQKHSYNQDKITTVMDIIGATTMPQQPKNHLQEIICDADLYHLSIPTYCELQDLLRKEWRVLLGQEYKEEDWQILNIAFLLNHQYFTSYGRKMLSTKKDKNVAICKKLLATIKSK